MKNTRVLVFALLLLPAANTFAADRAQLAFFENEIRPLFIERCIKCHGPKKSESGLRLDTLALATKGGDSGPAVIAGQPDASLLMKAVRHQDDLEMPPNGKLADREIDALARWIKSGAAWPDGMHLGSGGPQLRGGPITDKERAFWSFQPIANPQPLKIDGPQINNDIDRFVLRKLREAQLSYARPADRRTLIRRATFDLTGLPPTPEEIEAFLNDESSDAFAKVVERLLRSKAYGERWGRHWLDVVRYADTAGETGDYPTPLSYKYRNWVINAFNNDQPYDQFVREQIAGDILAEQIPDISSGQYREMVTATGFIAISRRFGFDVENYHHLTIQDTIDTVGQAFLGLSLGCARCHDHKYDPVNTNDYYSWYGIFGSTRYSFPGSEQKKRPYDLFPALPPTEAKRVKAAYDEKLAKVDAELKRLTPIQKQAEDRLKTVAADTVFIGFETQPIGAEVMKPWESLEDVKAMTEAQSSYENVFSRGSRGLAMPSNAGNNAFGRALAEAYTPLKTPKLYYNIDFKLTELKDNGGGAFRFYMGRGPGNSGAVEMSASAKQFFVKNGGGYEAVRDLKLGQWYNLQVTADLRNKTYSGTIGTPGDLTTFSGKAFTTGWDGIIDRAFVDKYGARGGVIPARHFDNLNVSTSPMLPVGKSVREHGSELAANRWLSYIEKRRIPTPQQNRDNHMGLNVWHSDPLPIIGYNSSDKTLMIPGTVPPKKLIVHPNTKEGAGVGWRSPIKGRVRITGRVQDAHNCGDSISWHVDHLSVGSFKTLAEGAINTNASQQIGTPNPVEADVRQGDFVQFAIMPKAHYGCDLTQIDLTIEEVDGKKRVWNLTADVGDDLLEGNPNDDRYGDATWYFYMVAVDRGQAEATKPLGKLTETELARERKLLDETTAAIAKLKAEQERITKVGPYELLYAAIEKDETKDAQIRIRGDRDKLGDVVPRKNLEILGNDPLPSGAGSGRLQMAEWLTRDNNPLLARVMVNRIWQHHFGRGLVGTENDFGTRGQRPTHPQLLDWLANRFKESGYSIKAMHRLIMASAAYQRSSDFNGKAFEVDPEAKLLWRFNRRRLSAEEIRDAMLLVSGDLDSTMGGEHPFPAIETWGFSQHAPYYGVYPTNRRSVYLMQQRLKRHPFLALFDGADPNVSMARRELTTVPTQALYMMNSEFVHQRAEGVAKRTLEATEQTEARVNFAFQQTLGRRPTRDELKESLAFLQEYRQVLESGASDITVWSGLARTLLTRNEFLFVD